MQRVFYQLCNVTPAEFWQYTQAETELMIDVKIKERELKDKTGVVARADLKCSIMNAACIPYLKKGERFPYKIEHFLPKDMHPARPDISEAEKSKRWSEAGHAMMKVVREHERETGVKV